MSIRIHLDHSEVDYASTFKALIIFAAVAAVGLAGADPFNVYKGHSCRTFYAEIPDWAGVAALGNAGVIGSYIDKADSRLECRIYITMPTLP